MSKIVGIKWAINDHCNLRCPYCIIGTESPKELPFNALTDLMDKMHSMSIKNIDFFGKEPLVDDTPFRLMQYAIDKGYTFRYSLITNGKNIEKYTQELLNSPLSQVTISYDGGFGGREFLFNPNSLKPLYDRGIDIQFSVDVHRKNLEHILKDIMPVLYAVGDISVYLKPIINGGKAPENTEGFCITPFEFYALAFDLVGSFPDKSITLSIPHSFSSIAMPLKCMLGSYPNKVTLFEDVHCQAGKDCLYLNSEGYAYSCGYACLNNPTKHWCKFIEATEDDIAKLETKGERHCLV